MLYTLLVAMVVVYRQSDFARRRRSDDQHLQHNMSSMLAALAGNCLECLCIF